MKKSTLAFLVITLISILISSCVTAGVNDSSQNGKYFVELEADSGVLPVLYHKGYAYVVGENNMEYSIRVYNNSNARVEAVVTVDGRDVISGSVGNYENSRGYVISPYSSVLIEGFRTSWQNVARFFFTDSDNSYSSRMGTPQNVGVIGVAVFEEKVKRIPRRRAPVAVYPKRGLGTGYAKSKKAPAPSSAPSYERSASGASSSYDGAAYDDAYEDEDKSEQQLGTGYGSQGYSPTSSTTFVRSSKSPKGKMAIYYDSYKGLLAKGVITRPAPRPVPCPDPFPKNSDPQFAPPPPAVYYRR
ncbi:MAG: hypothetical protein JXR91_02805 [Deltaproteobacteria bacterium]|nr:hypothetical protein [Deltaproteobacteria bacterium]